MYDLSDLLVQDLPLVQQQLATAIVALGKPTVSGLAQLEKLQPAMYVCSSLGGNTSAQSNSMRVRCILVPLFVLGNCALQWWRGGARAHQIDR